MARRRDAPKAGIRPEILPPELTAYTGRTAAEYQFHVAARRHWFLERGISPGDWQKVSAIQTRLRAGARQMGHRRSRARPTPSKGQSTWLSKMY